MEEQGSLFSEETRMQRSMRQLKNWQRIWIVALSALVLALGVSNAVKMGAAVVYWVRLPDLPMTVSWAYLVGEGLFWGVIFLTCAFGLLQFRAWGRSATLIAVVAYEVNVWVNHLCFEASVYARQSWPGDSAQSVFLLVLALVAFNLPGIRKVL